MSRFDEIVEEIQVLFVSAQRLHRAMASTPHSNAGWIGTFSPREAEVLELIAAGVTTPGVARALGIKPHTVNYHLKNIFEKLGLTGTGGDRGSSNRVLAARWWWLNVEAKDRTGDAG